MYTYIFPRVKHIDRLSIREQINQIDSEITEVRLAYVSPYIDHVGVELYDVIHSAETGLRMMEELGFNVRSLSYPHPPASVLPLYSQIKRLSSLADLARKEFDGNFSRGLAMALLGVIAGAEVALEILARVYHVDIDACRDGVIAKNTARGYYGLSNLAQNGCPAGAHSAVVESALPASPSLPQGKRELSNGPEENATC